MRLVGPPSDPALGRVGPRSVAELSALADRIASRVGRFLQRQGLLERDADNLCLSKLALDEEPMQARLSLTPCGLVRYQLKTPYSDGTTHVRFEPLDFIATLAAPVPTPRVNLTRFHGVFAPNSAHRAQLTKAGHGKDPRTSRGFIRPILLADEKRRAAKRVEG